jgi:hypothetical protein
MGDKLKARETIELGSPLAVWVPFVCLSYEFVSCNCERKLTNIRQEIVTQYQYTTSHFLERMESIQFLTFGV